MYNAHTHTHTHTVPPTVTPASQTTNTIQRGNNITLECSATGNRQPNFTWIYNGTVNLNELSRGHDSRFGVNTQSEVNSVTGRLTVSGASYGDAGMYTCNATNKAGSDSTNFTINIEGK